MNYPNFIQIKRKDLSVIKRVDKFNNKTRSRGYKTFFKLNSTEHEIYQAHKC